MLMGRKVEWAVEPSLTLGVKVSVRIARGRGAGRAHFHSKLPGSRIGTEKQQVPTQADNEYTTSRVTICKQNFQYARNLDLQIGLE